MRTIVNIPEREREALEALARSKGISRAEAVRQAIALYLAQEHVKTATPFGLWRDRAEDGLEYQHRLRDEW